MSMFPGKFTAREVAERWNVSVQRVFQIEQESQHDPDPQNRMPLGERLGGGARAAMVLWESEPLLRFEDHTGRGPGTGARETTNESES